MLFGGIAIMRKTCHKYNYSNVSQHYRTANYSNGKRISIKFKADFAEASALVCRL